MKINLIEEKSFKQAAVFGTLVATALLLLPACAGPQSTTTPAEESNVTTEELTDETAKYIGEEVTLRGEVQETVDETSFMIADGRFFGGEDILVINASTEPFVIPDVGDSQVQVTGRVETFAAETMASEYGLTLDPDLYEEYESKPVIIAESMALAPDPGDITENPEAYYNQRIAVEGEVGELLESGLFTVEEDSLFGGEVLLVIPSKAGTTVQDGDIVAMTGVLRPYIQSEFDQDYDLNWDLSVSKSIEAEYEQKPVFVADGVYPSAI
ncbi:MAG: hypothetical protein WBB01_14515 [Phormidesmis sp.]